MESQNNTQQNENNKLSPVSTQTDQPVKGSVFHRIITFCFKTKNSSIRSILLISIVPLFLFAFPMLSLITIAGPLGVLTPLIVWLIIAAILRSMGYKAEAANIGKALARIFLILLILGIIGFGVCLLLIAGWH